MAVIAGISAIVTAGATFINWLRSGGKAAQLQERRMEDLAETWGTSAGEIRAEMERYGLSLDEWEAKQRAALDETAARWGVYPGEIMEALDEITLDQWVEQQEEHLESLAEQWNVSTEYIMEALAEQEISMDEWAAQQNEMLTDLEELWGISTDEITAQMNEQGISASQWADKMGQAWDSFQADVARNVDSIVNGFRRIPEEYGQSAEDLREIMEANIATTAAWRENMVELAGEVAPEMLAWLESKGPEFNSVVAEMLYCGDELEAWVETFNSATALGMTQALDNIDDPVIRDAIVSRLGEAGQAAAESTALEDGYRAAIENANTTGVTLAHEGGVAIGEAAVDGATSVDYSAIPQEIVSAISGGQGDVVSAMANVVSDLREQFDQMRQQADTIAREMMIQMHTAITTKTMPIHSAMETVRTGTMNALVPLQTDIPRITTEAMNGAYQSLTSGGDRLIARARVIADSVAATMARALQVRSPSRVMIKLFGNVMDGIYVGMDRGEDSLLKKAAAIAENLTDALTIDNMLCKMQAIVDTGVLSPRATMAPAGAFAGGTSPGGPVYNITNTANVTAPTPMSEYQITREMNAMSRRMRRQLG